MKVFSGMTCIVETNIMDDIVRYNFSKVITDIRKSQKLGEGDEHWSFTLVGDDYYKRGAALQCINCNKCSGYLFYSLLYKLPIEILCKCFCKDKCYNYSCNKCLTVQFRSYRLILEVISNASRETNGNKWTYDIHEGYLNIVKKGIHFQCINCDICGDYISNSYMNTSIKHIGPNSMYCKCDMREPNMITSFEMR